MIPVLYKANETDFTHLGLGVLMDTLRAEVTEERNGVFELELDYPVDGQLFNSLKNDRLIRVNASPQLSDQRFRIVHMEKKANQIMTVYAEHVSYLSQDLALNPTVNYSGTAQNALNTWSSNIVDSHPFTTFSDISHSANGRWEIEDVENARRALGGVRGSLLDSYGGEYRFDNYHIQLWQDRGKDSGVLIAYGKNLVDLEQEEEITSTYTSIYPYAIAEDENGNQGERITLPELFIDSEHVDKYARRKILVVDFSQDEVKTVQALRSRAEQYIEANNIGVPKVNIRVSFQDLAKTLDYKDLSLVEEINLCDMVDVYYEKLDIQTNAKIIKTVWNVLLDEYKELEIGEARSSLSQAVNNIVDGKVDEVDRRVNRVQIAANGKNRIFRGTDEPTQGMTVNDLWYKPVGEGETELYRWNGEIWELEKVSAGLLGGTLDAENGDVNLINVNVAKIVGEISEFVRSYWNDGAGGGVTIEGDGIHARNANTDMTLRNGRMRAIGRNDDNWTEFGINGIRLENGAFFERNGPVSNGMTWSVPGFMEFVAWGERSFAVFSGGLSYYKPLTMTGSNNHINARNINANETDLLRLNGARSELGDLTLGAYSGGQRYLNSTAAREFTISSASTLGITEAGDLRRITSASKYKVDITKENNQLDYGYKLLNLDLTKWFDKGEVERLADAMNWQYGTDGIEVPVMHYGLIAEDVADAGLTPFVDYQNGEVEGIYYDRLWLPLIPVVRKQQEEIQELKSELSELKQLLKDKGVI